MLDSKQLLEKRGEHGAHILKMRDELHASEEKDFSTEQQEQWDKLNEEYDEFGRNLAIATRSEQITSDLDGPGNDGPRQVVGIAPLPVPAGNFGNTEKASAAPGPTVEQRDRAMRAWARAVRFPDSITDEDRAAASACSISLGSNDVECRMFNTSEVRELRRRTGPRFESRQMDTTTGTGGELIPEGFVNNWERALLAFGGMRQVSTIIRTATGNDLPWPTTDDTSNAGSLLAENTVVPNQDIATAALVFNAFKYTSEMVKISVELLEDSAFNLPAEMGSFLGERIGRITNTHFTTGDGSSKPNGVNVAATTAFTAAATGAVTSDELIDLFHAVDPAYRIGPKVVWMFNDNTAAAIRKLVINTEAGNYIWQPGLQSGMPDMLLGRPVVINQDLPDMATTTKSILFGDFSKYIIRDVANFRLRRLVERFADLDQEGFVAFSRHDGDLLDAGTAPIKFITQAT